ncbi:MAG TPA: hypothetical protein VND65_12605 [Candidatus Binatia bacterium]|nr:hypothetical protein [Candidatus Binatia bacterium]
MAQLFSQKTIRIGVTMTPSERDRMNLLSMLIQCERSHQKYVEYVSEINELMAQKEKRLEEAESRSSAGGDGARPS